MPRTGNVTTFVFSLPIITKVLCCLWCVCGIVQDERSKPTQQFGMRIGTAVDKVSVSRNSKIFSNKLEKEKAYEGQRLPMSPTGMTLWMRM